MKRARALAAPAAGGTLSVAQLRLTYIACALVYATGILWIAAHYGLTPTADATVARHPLESSSLALHGAAAMGFLVAFGGLLPRHIPEGLRARRNLSTGIVMIGTAAALAATGWALYYVAAEALREWLSFGHWLLGLAAGPILALHALLGRRRSAAAGT